MENKVRAANLIATIHAKSMGAAALGPPKYFALVIFIPCVY